MPAHDPSPSGGGARMTAIRDHYGIEQSSADQRIAVIADVLAVRALNHPNRSVVMSRCNPDRYGVDQLAHDAAMAQAVRCDHLRITAGCRRRDRERLTERTRKPSVIARPHQQRRVFGSAFGRPLQTGRKTMRYR